MKVEIIDKEITFNLYGFAGIAVNHDYKAMAFQLMDKMWQTVKADQLKHKGMNIWVYEPGEKVFVGLELHDDSHRKTSLQENKVILQKYAYYKHVGPYHLIKQVGDRMVNEIKTKGFDTRLPYIEIYGHWTPDENQLETELLMSLK